MPTVNWQARNALEAVIGGWLPDVPGFALFGNQAGRSGTESTRFFIAQVTGRRKGAVTRRRWLAGFELVGY